MNSRQVLSESERLVTNRNGERPSGLSISIDLVCTDYDIWLTNVVTVMDLVIQNKDQWPEDSYWQQHLPQWLLTSFRQYTPKEIAQIRSDKSKWANLAWIFGSWLDRMRDRSWEWWSVEYTQNAVTIHLAIDGFPVSAKALEHLATVAGGTLL